MLLAGRKSSVMWIYFHFEGQHRKRETQISFPPLSLSLCSLWHWETCGKRDAVRRNSSMGCHKCWTTFLFSDTEWIYHELTFNVSSFRTWLEIIFVSTWCPMHRESSWWPAARSRADITQTHSRDTAAGRLPKRKIRTGSNRPSRRKVKRSEKCNCNTLECKHQRTFDDFDYDELNVFQCPRKLTRTTCSLSLSQPMCARQLFSSEDEMNH
jgi:hypothetical protein